MRVGITLPNYGPLAGGENLARLARIRTALDPDGVFRFPQSA